MGKYFAKQASSHAYSSQILINEMKLEPWDKTSCLAMLNTLYPPVISSSPTSKLTIPMLLAQRDGFFKYIRTVDKCGAGVLEGLIMQGAKEGDANGWPAVKRTLVNYLALANSTIAECQEISRMPIEQSHMEVDQNLTSYSRTPAIPRPDEPEQRERSKTDSGISFGDAFSKHSKNPSTSSSKSAYSNGSRTTSGSEFGYRASALERFARELKKMRPRTRVTVDEIIKPGSMIPPAATTSPIDTIREHNIVTPTPPPMKRRFHTLKKIRSLGDLKYHNSNGSSSSLRPGSSAVPAFDEAAMKRQREDYERKGKW
jgi:hypothetical protein